MSPGLWFGTALALTVALLVAVVVTGLRARRRAHLTLVACTLACLVWTIVLAERLGELYDLESAGRITPVHLTIAKIAAGLYLLPLVTGIRTLRDPRFRPLHRRAAILTLAVTAAAFVTGTWMVLAAERIA